MLSKKSLSYDLQVKWSRVSDTNLFNTDCHDQAFPPGGDFELCSLGAWCSHACVNWRDLNFLCFFLWIPPDVFGLMLPLPVYIILSSTGYSSSCTERKPRIHAGVSFFWIRSNCELCDLLGLTFRIVLFCSELVLQPQALNVLYNEKRVKRSASFILPPKLWLGFEICRDIVQCWRVPSHFMVLWIKTVSWKMHNVAVNAI